ncbi:hypothetical protein V1503_18885 [Bacillus sp. SCS-151]|uniref:hypothetical protein n=1 Tax=Nanhaiella sioensis TaxID=3115293 RepID=UPI00397AC6DA
MTTYDQIWSTFLNNCKVSDIDLPQYPEKIYEVIQNGAMYFNNRLRLDLICDNDSESVSHDLGNDQLLIMANFIRLLFLKNQKTYFESLWQPFQKDVGQKNFSTQLKSLESSISDQERTIERLIMNMEEDFL